MLVDAAGAQIGVQKFDRTIGVCHLVANPFDPAWINSMSPALAAKNFYRAYEHLKINGQASVTVLKMPEHGVLEGPVKGSYVYYPEKGYLGNDRATLMVEVDGKKIRMEYFFRVMRTVPSAAEDEPPIEEQGYCPKKAYVWKISSAQDANGEMTLIASLIATDTADNASGDSNTSESIPHFDTLDGLANGLSNITLSITNRADGALGQTIGTSITLDDNAAGHGWYIDYTPYLNEEYLPTANPNEWIAKADSEAAGKMDMLSVLLHEYGHALGIEHSASAHDYMATTLAPGVRRLPSADELALMAKLAGDLRLELAGDSTPSPDNPSSPLPSVPLGGSLGLALLGRLRGNRFGGWNVAVDSVSPLLPSAPQYAVAANPKLSNTEFAGGQGWSTTGDVRFQDGAATLTEAAASQTRLNQVFIVGENDRFLSFTVADTALDDADQAPDDAFEVALLDANSGASLLGGTGLTRNDAFLNLQADGTERKSQAVTSIRNADSSRTYLVDLAGIPAGTAVNLAFDLIGFGKGAAAVSSHLTIRDLRIGVPQAKDDSATLAEDSTISIAALANDRGLQMSAQQPGFVPVIVDAPAHGQVTINADGTFSFTPDQDWNGADQFTYAPKEVPLGDKLSDGHVDSNLATVSLTVTLVNDAPVAVDDAGGKPLARGRARVRAEADGQPRRPLRAAAARRRARSGPLALSDDDAGLIGIPQRDFLRGVG